MKIQKKKATSRKQNYPLTKVATEPVRAGNSIPRGYAELLDDLKNRIRTSQIKAALSVNRELVLLYWEIGAAIGHRQQDEGWGSKVIDRLSADLVKSFPEMQGFSIRNLKYMKKFAENYPDIQFVQQAAAQIPWSHNCIILDKINLRNEREWYIQNTIEHGWSRNILAHQIESDLYHRQGKAVTNFKATLPPPQSDLAQQTIKDPYIFDFLTLGAEAREKELEKGLLLHIEKFLLELGAGFSLVGRQVHLEVGDDDFYIDLLFYHLKLRCFVVIELKTEPFKPEFTGKLNFYLSAVDDRMRQPDDKPTIGLLLCRSKNKLQVEYALRDMVKPIGVSEWQTKIVEKLPTALKGSLPTIEEIEIELGEK